MELNGMAGAAGEHGSTNSLWSRPKLSPDEVWGAQKGKEEAAVAEVQKVTEMWLTHLAFGQMCHMEGTKGTHSEMPSFLCPSHFFAWPLVASPPK